MVVIQSLKRVPGLLVEQPILFVPVILYVLLQTPQFLSEAFDPVIALLVSGVYFLITLFVPPFIQGGMIGITNDAATGDRTSLGRFFALGKRYYVSVLGAYLVVFAFTFGLAFILGFVGSIAAAVYFAFENLLVALVLGAIALVIFLVYLALVALVQFYAHAIVIDGEGAIDGLRRSVSVVRGNIRAVLGYYAILLVGGLLFTVAYVGVYLWAFPQPEPDGAAALPDPSVLLAGVAISTLLLTVFSTAYFVYSVVFYRGVAVDRSSPV